MRRSILVGKFERLTNTNLHLSGFSALGSFYDTSSLSNIEHCMRSRSCRQPLVFLESLDKVLGGGVHEAYAISFGGPNARYICHLIRPFSQILIRLFHFWSHGNGNSRGGLCSGLNVHFVNIARPGCSAARRIRFLNELGYLLWSSGVQWRPLVEILTCLSFHGLPYVSGSCCSSHGTFQQVCLHHNHDSFPFPFAVHRSTQPDVANTCGTCMQSAVLWQRQRKTACWTGGLMSGAIIIDIDSDLWSRCPCVTAELPKGPSGCSTEPSRWCCACTRVCWASRIACEDTLCYGEWERD